MTPPLNHAVACDAESSKVPERWYLRRKPKCNRPSGHDGPHREYDRRTAEIKAEWER